MIFDLTQEESQHLLNVLGEMPTRLNVFPIAVKLQQQMQFQADVVANLTPDKKEGEHAPNTAKE